jgi:MFS family permease
MAGTLPRPAVVAIITFTVGAAALGTEIAAARLLAPWFGASTIVWANTIATVLLALSAGYWLGGRLAERWPGLYGLCLVTLAAAVLLAVVPFVARPFLRASADALDDVSAGVFVGSLLGVCVLVAAPVLALGMVSPYAVRLSVAGAEGAGRVSGRLYAISTLGSLVGTFAAALGLIPLLGTRRTFLVFALALALAACLGLPLRALVAPAAIAALMLVPTGTIKAEDGARVIWEAETDYQYARVVERADGRRRLELNEARSCIRPTSRGAGSPAATGTRPWCSRSPARAGRRADRDPRWRRGDQRARLLPLLPRHPHRPGGDRRRAARRRAPALRPPRPTAPRTRGRRPPVPAPG